MKITIVSILFLVLISCNIRKNNEKVTDIYEKGLLCLQSYNYGDAKKYFYNIINNPANSDSVKLMTYFQLYYTLKFNEEKSKLDSINYLINSLYKNPKNSWFRVYYYRILLEHFPLKGKFREAIDSFQIIRPYLTEKDPFISRIYLRLAHCYERLNNIDSSFYYNLQAYKLLNNSKIEPFEKATYYAVMANFYSEYFKNTYSAKIYFDSVLFVVNHCKNIDSVRFGWFLFKMGTFYSSFGSTAKSEEYLSKAYDIYVRHKGPEEDKAMILRSIALTNAYSRKFSVAHKKIDQSIDILIKGKNENELAYSYTVKGFTYYLEKEYGKSIEFYSKALEYFKKNNSRDKFISEQFIAFNYIKLKRYEEAEVFFTRAICSVKEGKVTNILTFYGEYSRLLIKLGKYNEALDLILSSEPVVLSIYGENGIRKGYFLYWKALALYKLKQYENSLNAYNTVIESSSINCKVASCYEPPVFSNTAIQSHDNIIDALKDKAKILEILAGKEKQKEKKEYYLEQSYFHYLRAQEIVEIHSQKIESENDKLFFTEVQSPLNKSLINSSVSLYSVTNKKKWLENSFYCSDKSKATIMTLGLHDVDYKKIAGIPDSLIINEKKQKEDIAMLESSIQALKKSKKSEEVLISKLNNKLIREIIKLENQEKYTEKKYPQYNSLKYSTSSFSLDSIRKNLGRKKTLIEYSLTDSSLYTFVLNSDSLFLVKSNSVGLTDSINEFRKIVSKISPETYSNKGFKSYIKLGYWLYTKLISPVEKYIRTKELIVIPDAELNTLPFETLVTSVDVPVAIDYGLLSYLVQKYVLSYTYSTELFYLQNKIPSSVTDGVAAFAPEYDNLEVQMKRANNNGSEVVLGPLFGNKEEVNEVVKLAGGDAFIGKNATEKTFKKVISSGKILHLAMHTVLNNEFPLYSKLVFTATKDSINEGLLNTYEIYSLKLKSPLVVLSACNTGFGPVNKGEGIISMARGFVYAGCPSMVITMWSIPDNSCTDLMKTFYTSIKDKDDKALSLQMSKMYYIKNSDRQKSHPYYWAGFILSGKTDAIQLQKSHFLSYYFSLAAIGILMVIIFIFWFKKWR